jgi:hypothetical protein
MRRLAKKHRVKVGEYIRAIIVDAIADEEADALQRSGTQGCPTSGERSEASGAAAS